jgi:hypothetical protein
MSGQGKPPEGTPEGTPGGGDDEYRSVVFDESFVRAARIQEYSARERLDGTSRTVRNRRPWSRSGASRQALVLVTLIALAFGTAIYLGIRNPYQQPPTPVAQPLRITLIPLTPSQPVPAADLKQPFEGHPAADYRSGAAGITLPLATRTAHFSESQVIEALSTVKEYLVASSIDPETLTGGDVRAVRNLLAPGQLEQFDASLEKPADDGRHAATGWMVRFDPARVRLANDQVRVRGTMTLTEVGGDVLEVVTDHTLVYAVRDAAAAGGAASLFTVRRELRFRIDHDDLDGHEVEVVQAAVEAGPLSCAGPSVQYFRPLLAGQLPQALAGIDPYDHDHEITSVCGVLAAEVSASVTPTAAPTTVAPTTAALPTAVQASPVSVSP